MADDILDAAQKAINDAAVGAKATPMPTDTTPTPPSIPVEPAPIPAVSEPSQPPQTEQPIPPKQEEVPILPVPPVADPSLEATKQAMMNELLGSSTVAAVTPSSSQPPQHPNGNFAQKKKPRTGVILAVIALLLLTVPIAVYFVSQSGPIAELRGKAAWDTVYQGCTLNSCPSGYTCHCQNGNACTYTWCERDIEQQCRDQGREYCVNGYNGNAKTCCYPGYSCGPGGVGCYQDGGDDNGDDDDTVEPTPTASIVPVCQNIKIYKGATQVTPSTLLPGDVVTLAVKGNLSPTKARFRINGGAWQETTTKNASNEFTLSYTIPDGVPDFVIEGEVFTNGAWY